MRELSSLPVHISKTFLPSTHQGLHLHGFPVFEEFSYKQEVAFILSNPEKHHKYSKKHFADYFDLTTSAISHKQNTKIGVILQKRSFY
jgi:hypothetical protein